MFVSVSRSAAEADHAHVFFDTVEVQTFRELAKIVCGPRRWSPLTWKDGRRLQSNFEGTELVVLDFDNGELTLEDAQAHFRAENIRFILGLTRSHGIPKGNSPAQDRFRVVLHMDSPLTHLPRYKQNMRRILDAYPADKACGDGARIYRPCTRIVAAGDGDRVAMLPYQEPPKVNPDIGVTMRLLGKIPDWVREALLRDIPGQRNQTVFRIAARMTSYGFSEAEIRRMILDSPISLSVAEKEAAIGSGIRAGRQSQ